MELVDDVLCKVVGEMVEGLIDVDFGGGVVKKWVVLVGCGKCGGV